jgi:hypothetical protein
VVTTAGQYEDLVGNGLTGPGQLEPAVDFFDESLFVEPLREAVTRRSRNVQTLFDLPTIERLVAECF